MPNTELATWLVTSGETTHQVLADSWKQEAADDGDDYPGRVTRFYRDGKVVAEFRHHSSIVKKGDGARSSSS